jgi:UDPglucose 6-dehydrogenase
MIPLNSPEGTFVGSKILVVGAGYVGLTSGICLASLGNEVVCVDNNIEKIDLLQAGKLPIFEPGLLDLLNKGIDRNLLRFSTDLIKHAKNANFIFLCLPTPPLEDGTADMSFVYHVVDEISPHLNGSAIIVNKSTVPLNTSSEIKSRQLNKAVAVVSNPEFLREGSAVTDFLNPSRIVIGADERSSAIKVAALYAGLEERVFITDPVSAECIKYMSNGFLAMKVSFINQAARFCEAIGADVVSVSLGMSLDPRIGRSFLNPGPGWGGSCFPKDTAALAAAALSKQSPMTLVEQAANDNKLHQNEIARLITKEIRDLGKTAVSIGVLGLSFKANTDDTRDSPALKIIELIEMSNVACDIRAYDPEASIENRATFSRVDSISEAIIGSDLVIILTEWPEFALFPPESYASLMKGNTIIDTRYVLDNSLFHQCGLRVRSMGRVQS